VTAFKPLPANVLPPDAVRLLTQASEVATPGSRERQLAIEKATARVRLLFPQFFTDKETS
jgi:hypothetical protein